MLVASGHLNHVNSLQLTCYAWLSREWPYRMHHLGKEFQTLVSEPWWLETLLECSNGSVIKNYLIPMQLQRAFTKDLYFNVIHLDISIIVSSLRLLRTLETLTQSINNFFLSFQQMIVYFQPQICSRRSIEQQLL